MNKLRTITATYRIVTPMFMGGADKAADSIRPPSVKGALRFWWRALNWSQVRSNTNSDKDALIELHRQESEIFGNTPAEKAPKVGQSVFSLRIRGDIPTPSSLPRMRGSKAYLGYGLEDRGNQALTWGDTFTVELSYHLNRATKEKIGSVEDALMAIGLFGGLGGRSRNGFGSIAMESINDTHFPCNTFDDYRSFVRKLLGKYIVNSTALPSFTAFSQHATVSYCEQRDHADIAHTSIGERYKNFRRYLNLQDRVPFGLPLERYDRETRRASPLFIHLHPIGNDPQSVFSVCLFLPATFHNNALRNRDDHFFDVVRTFATTRSQKVIFP